MRTNVTQEELTPKMTDILQVSACPPVRSHPCAAAVAHVDSKLVMTAQDKRVS